MKIILVIALLVAAVSAGSWPPDSYWTSMEMHTDGFTIPCDYVSSKELSRTKYIFPGAFNQLETYGPNGKGSMSYIWSTEQDCEAKNTNDFFPLIAYPKVNGTRSIRGIMSDCYMSEDKALTLCVRHDDNGIPVYQCTADAVTLKPITEIYYSDFHGERPDDSKLAVPTFCPHHNLGIHHHVLSEAEQAFRRALRQF